MVAALSTVYVDLTRPARDLPTLLLSWNLLFFEVLFRRFTRIKTHATLRHSQLDESKHN